MRNGSRLPGRTATFVSLGFLDLHTEMSVDSAQHVTCGLWAEGVGTINFTLDTGFPPAAAIAIGVSRGGWAHPNPSLAWFGVVYFDEISAYSTNGHQPFPAGGDAVTMVDQNGATLAQPDMLTD